VAKSKFLKKMRKIIVYLVENRFIDCPVCCLVTGDVKEAALSAANTI